MGKVWMAVAMGAVVLVACGDDTVSPSGGGASTSLTNCGPDPDTSGTYLAAYTQQSGDCGPIPDTQGAPAAGFTSACIVTSSTWTDGNCIFSDSFDCANSQVSASGSETIALQTTDGSRISGTMTITTTYPAVCSGTYSVSYVRE